jgi:hypothetical protein
MARKRKIKKQEEKDIIKELDGFSLDDNIWAEYFGGRIIQGKIVKLINTEPKGNAASLITQSDGYRTVLLSSCSHSIIKKKRISKLRRK